jgi:hypothetical protein
MDYTDNIVSLSWPLYPCGERNIIDLLEYSISNTHNILALAHGEKANEQLLHGVIIEKNRQGRSIDFPSKVRFTKI